jgi:predicted membrane protein
MEERLTPSVPIASIKLVLGIFFTVVGVLLTLDNLRIFSGHQYLKYWPAVLIVIGLLKLGDVSARGLSIALIAAGSLLLTWTTRWVRFSIFDLWPLVFIVAGIVIVAQSFGVRPASSGWIAVLTQRKIAIDSRDFTGGRIVVFMGGVELDLSAADIAHGPAVIEIFTLMGGVSIRVPDGWDVVGDAVPFMGGIDVKTRSKRTGRQLILRGLVMMGGVDVKDVAARIA